MKRANLYESEMVQTYHDLDCSGASPKKVSADGSSFRLGSCFKNITCDVAAHTGSRFLDRLLEGVVFPKDLSSYFQPQKVICNFRVILK